MKSDRQTYMTQCLQSGGMPLACGNADIEGIAQATFHYEPDELMTRFPLNTSGNDSTSFCHSRMLSSGILSPAISSESYCCKLTMEEVLSRRKIPPDRDIGEYSQKAGIRYQEACRSIQSLEERDVSISWVTGQIQNTNAKVFGYRDMKQKIFNRLQLEVGESYSNKLLSPGLFSNPSWQYTSECDSTTASDLAGPLSGWRFRDWCQGSSWQNYVLPIHLSVACPPSFWWSYLAEWNSLMVESVRLILQRWSRVYSFSSTICCAWNADECEIANHLAQEKISQPKG